MHSGVRTKDQHREIGQNTSYLREMPTYTAMRPIYFALHVYADSLDLSDCRLSDEDAYRKETFWTPA